MKYQHYVHNKENAQKCAGWYISRKYNGVAGWYDGGITEGQKCRDIPWSDPKDSNKTSSGLWTIGRDGYPKPVNVPRKWINKHLVKGISVQGEIWCNDDLALLGTLSKRVNLETFHIDLWLEEVKFIPYNIRPYNQLIGFKEWADKYPDRFDSIKTLITKHNTYEENLKIIDEEYKTAQVYSYETESRNELFLSLKIDTDKPYESIDSYIELAKAEKWEGLVLTNPKCKYEAGKTTKQQLKWKQMFDHEVKCIGWEYGDGKYSNVVGKLVYEITWSDRVTSIPGGRPDLIGKTLKSTVNLRGDGTRSIEYVTNHYLGNRVDVTFNAITKHGLPQHCRLSDE